MERVRRFQDGMGAPSKRLVISYILDWTIVLLTVIVALALSRVTPNNRPFSLNDPNISFPFVHKEKVPPVALVAIVVVVPGLIVCLVCLLFVPGPTVDHHAPRALIWRRKLWELNAGLLGLALALAATYLLTDGMKNLFGKPRPDLLSRCDPDVSRAREFAVGGLGGRLGDFETTLGGGVLLVSSKICRKTTKLKDGFRSFPSGHASSSFAGLTYLTLFLCSKFAIAIPFLAPRPFGRARSLTAAFSRHAHSHLHPHDGSRGYGHRKGHQRLASDDGHHTIGVDSEQHPPIRNQAAAPPVYLLILAFIPMGAAIYIASSRWSDFRHHGFDILAGSTLGLSSAWFAFRWYHLPIREGAGWAWGARSRDRAFCVGVGVSGYVGEEGWSSGHVAQPIAQRDMEMGHVDRPDTAESGSSLLTVPQPYMGPASTAAPLPVISRPEQRYEAVA